MGTLRSRRGWAVGSLAVFLVAAAVLAGGVVAGQFRGADPEAFRADLATGEVVRVADIAAADGLASRGVFVQRTGMGQMCIWDAPSAQSRQRQGGCNPDDDPLGGGQLTASLAYEGGPALADVRDARLIGLASAAVASVAVVMSDGSERPVQARETRIGSRGFLAFGYRLLRADLRKSIGPVAVVAYDASGREIGRQTTGIG